MKIRKTEQGVHFFSRDSGTNLLLDEIEIPQGELARAPANVSVAVTNRCNRCCPHCFAEKGDEDLDYEVLCGWMDELDANGCMGVGFGGGEPLLHPRIVDLCRFVAKNTEMACTMTTNGDCLTQEMVDRLCCSVNFIRVSTNGAKGALGILPYLCGRIRCGVNYLVNEDSFASLERDVGEYEDMGVQEVLLLPQMTVGGCPGADASLISQVDDFLTNKRFRIRLSVSAVWAEHIHTAVEIPGDQGVRQYLHVSARGILKRSSFEPSGVKIGKDGIMSAIGKVYENEGVEQL